MMWIQHDYSRGWRPLNPHKRMPTILGWFQTQYMESKFKAYASFRSEFKSSLVDFKLSILALLSIPFVSHQHTSKDKKRVSLGHGYLPPRPYPMTTTAPSLAQPENYWSLNLSISTMLSVLQCCSFFRFDVFYSNLLGLLGLCVFYYFRPLIHKSSLTARVIKKIYM